MPASRDSFPILAEIGNHTHEGVIIFNVAEKRIVYINAIARELSGLDDNAGHFSVEDMLIKVPEEDRAYVQSEFQRLVTQDFTTEIEFELIDPNGKLLWVCCNAFYVSQKTCIVLFIKDISKAKQAQNYLIEFGTRKNNMLDTVVHNISGALLLSRNLSAMAEESLGAEEMKNLRGYLQLLKDNNQHCIDTITGLSRAEYVMAPEIPVKTSRMEVVEKVNIIFTNLVSTFVHRKFAFHTSVETIYSYADEFKVLQIVNNLISNAIKFTPDDKEISISVIEQNNDVVIRISDEGIGIPDTLKPFVFERSSLSGRVGLKGERSFGFGLYICRQLANSIKGNIWFESEVGEGSVFYLSIPGAGNPLVDSGKK